MDDNFSRTDSTGSYSHLRDGLGSTLALTDASGAIQTSYTYEPFGVTASSGVANGNLNQYTGRENDGGGIYYYRARYYNANLGRFISQDPIGFRGGINPYSYAFNNPVSFIDPSGKSNFLVHFYETFRAAIAAGWEPGIAANLAFEVLWVDAPAWLGGTGTTMGTSASDANQHGMGGQKPDGTWQTCSEAAAGTAAFVNSMTGRGWSFARALHAVQDSYSGSHDYQPFNGHAMNPEHQGPDAKYSSDAITASVAFMGGAGASALNPNVCTDASSAPSAMTFPNLTIDEALQGRTF